MRLLAIILGLALAAGAQAQSSSASPTAASGTAAPLVRQSGTSLPATCAVGQLYFKSDATAGKNVYMCASTNTWTQQVNVGSGSVSVASGKTLTVNKSLTLDGTDSTTMTFPSTSATIARTDAANTFTGTQSFSSPTVVTGTVAADDTAAGKVGEYQEVKCLTSTSGTTIAFTSATPTVGTWASPPWTGTNVSFGNFACPFQITANAPTGLSTATNYWAVPINATTFNVSTSAANAAAGTFAATSGSVANANLTSSLVFTTTAGLATAVHKLTAGDWDCSGSTLYTLGATTSVTNVQNGINTASTTIGALGTYNDLETAANIMTATNNPIYSTPVVRINISSTTAYYLVSLNTFTASTANGSGFMRCRRQR